MSAGRQRVEYRPHMLPKVRSAAITNAAVQMPCTLRIASFLPGGRCSGQDTVVAAHLPVGGKGLSTKVSDLHIAAACQRCHDLLDGRAPRSELTYLQERYPAAIMHRCLSGHAETLDMLLVLGLIRVPGFELP